MSSLEPEALLHHARFIRSLARSLVADPQAAEDLVQETWRSVIDRPPSHAANPRGWFVRVVHRLAGGERRRAASREQRERDRARGESTPSTAEAVVRREVLRRVNAAVLALKEPYHTTVLLRFYEGLDAREIAAQMGVPVATVQTRLRRGLELLRARLDTEYGGDRKEWCFGLVSLLASRRIAEVSSAGGGSLGLGTGVVLMGTNAKIGLAVATVCVAGLLAWNSTRQGRLEAPGSMPSEAELGSLIGAETQDRASDITNASAAHETGRQEVEDVPSAAVEARRGSLEVHVRWERDGRPAADQELSFHLYEHPVGDRKRRGFTDSEGNVRLEDLSAGRVSIDTSHGGRASVDVSVEEPMRVEISIPKGFAARGRVTDPDGRGVAGASLWLSSHFNYTHGYLVAETRVDGSFELTEIPEARYLGALADGFAPSHLHYLPDDQAQRAALQDIELELVLVVEGGGLDVLAVDEGGEPVPGVYVHAEGARIARLNLGNGRSRQGLRSLHAWTGEGGRAKFRSLPPGTVHLKAYAPGMAFWTGTASASAGEVGELRIELRPECVVFGVVSTAAGDPVAGARVRLLLDSEPMLGAMKPSTVADESGHYELRGLPAGSVRLRASDDEHGGVIAKLEVASSEPLRWDPTLDPGRAVVGRVTDLLGEPLAGWTVQASLPSGAWYKQAVSDEEGRFQLVDCEPGTLTLELYRDEGVERVPTLSRSVRMDDQDDVLFRVGPDDLCDGGFRGRLVSPDGEPLSKGTLTAWPAGESSAPGFKTDAEGRFEALSLHAGTYDLVVNPREWPRFYVGRFQLAAAEVRDLGALHLPKPGRLHVTVAGAGLSASGPYFRLSVQQLDPRGGESLQSVYGVHGDSLTEWIELYPGEYVVHASANGAYASERIPVTIEGEGQERVVDLQPRAGRECRLGVSIPEGDSLPSHVTFVLRDEEDAELSRTTSNLVRGRRFSLYTQLAPGRYTLEAEASDGRRLRHAFDVTIPSVSLPTARPTAFEEIVPLR